MRKLGQATRGSDSREVEAEGDGLLLKEFRDGGSGYQGDVFWMREPAIIPEFRLL
jgi:hypothetical protein